MMIEYKTGNILTQDSEAIVNTVNCVGVMGRGIALQFKKAFPENFNSYAAACKRKEVQPGHMFVFELGDIIHPRYIINFPTKRHWRDKSRIEDIESGLEALTTEIRVRNIRSVAIPPLGSGLGGLEWAEVKQRIERAFSNMNDVSIIVLEPESLPTTEEMVVARNLPAMTAGRATLIELMDCYLRGLLDPFVTLLEVHKLMYFMQEAGESLNLRFQKAPYGPYAENLRHVFHAIEGYFISGFADGGDVPGKQLTLMPGALQKATEFLSDGRHTKTKQRLEQVKKLVTGFESPFGLELLATVHWVMKHEQIESEEKLIDCIYDWGDRKRQFSPRQISLAVDVLSSKGWVDSF